MAQDFPTLSLKERDRRYANVRAMMKEKGLDCLIVAGLLGRDEWDAYFSNEGADHGFVIFPLKEEPICLPWYHGRIIRNIENLRDGHESWMTKWRAGATGATVYAAMQELGITSGNIGVIGLGSHGTRSVEGFIPYKTWAFIQEHMPQANFTDVTEELGKAILVKSDEEIALARYAAKLGENACRELLNATKVGASEAELFALILYTILRGGGGMREPILVMRSGQKSITWSKPMWTYQSQKPRTMQPGDIVECEIFGIYGGVETQQQMCIHISPVQPVHKELAECVRRTYETGRKALRPGKTFGEVWAEMEKVVADAGYWHTSPLLHSLTPQVCMGASDVGIEKAPPEYRATKGDRTFQPKPAAPDVVIKPGMLFELEPNACKDWHRVNFGGSLLVTKDGNEELNSLPTQMRIV